MSPPGKDFVVSSVKAVRTAVLEDFVLHADHIILWYYIATSWPDFHLIKHSAPIKMFVKLWFPNINDNLNLNQRCLPWDALDEHIVINTVSLYVTDVYSVLALFFSWLGCGQIYANCSLVPHIWFCLCLYLIVYPRLIIVLSLKRTYIFFIHDSLTSEKMIYFI